MRPSSLGTQMSYLVNRLRGVAPAPSPVHVPGTATRLYVRPGTTDMQAFNAVFRRRQHDVPIGFTPRVVVDLGANVGFTSVDFALRYPGARVIAVEPEPGNVKMLRLNTAAFDGIEVVEAAIWSHAGRVALADVGHGEWGFVTVPAADVPTVGAMTMHELMCSVGIDAIDLLKVDVEGAEHVLIANDPSWLDVVRGLYVELHETSPGATRRSETILAQHGFVLRDRREENSYYERPAAAEWRALAG
jgi:FkbM family methyltransferase